MNNKSYTQEFTDMLKGIWLGFVGFLDEYDAQSWPAFGVFFSVITLGMYMNFMGFRIVIGDFPAVMISLFFESAILAWKMTGNRKRNDAKQNQLSNTATWLSVLLAVAMLIVNLMRVGGEEQFDNIAYSIVGAAAMVQVIFYLFWDQANPDKKMNREHLQSERELNRKEHNANNVIGEVEADMKIVRKIATELNRLAKDYSDLPVEQLEYLLEEARTRLLNQYAKGKHDIEKATRGLADKNKDGKIGTVGKSSNQLADTLPPYTNPAIQPDLDKIKENLEKIKELPVDVLFESDVPEALPTEDIQEPNDPSDF